jgi:hypothetical protein
MASTPLPLIALGGGGTSIPGPKESLNKNVSCRGQNEKQFESLCQSTTYLLMKTYKKVVLTKK